MEEQQRNKQGKPGRRGGVRLCGGRVGRQNTRRGSRGKGHDTFLMKYGPLFWTMFSIMTLQWLRRVESTAECWEDNCFPNHSGMYFNNVHCTLIMYYSNTSYYSSIFILKAGYYTFTVYSKYTLYTTHIHI